MSEAVAFVVGWFLASQWHMFLFRKARREGWIAVLKTGEEARRG
jgi:predicted permease